VKCFAKLESHPKGRLAAGSYAIAEDIHKNANSQDTTPEIHTGFKPSSPMVFEVFIDAANKAFRARPDLRLLDNFPAWNVRATTLWMRTWVEAG